MIEGLQLGTIEATIVSSGTLANFVPDTGVFDIPFLFRDLDHARAVLDGEIGQEILGKFDAVGLHGLAWGNRASATSPTTATPSRHRPMSKA